MPRSKEQLHQDYIEILEVGFVGTYTEYLEYILQFKEDEDFHNKSESGDMPF